MLRSVSIRPPTLRSSGSTRPASEHWPSTSTSHRPMRVNRLPQQDEQMTEGRTGDPSDEAVTRPGLGLPQGLEDPPRAGGDLKVELDVAQPEIVAGYLADPPEPALPAARLYRHV